MTQALLAAGAVGAVLFVVVFSVDGATRSGYSSARHPVSALALGERGWLQITNFVVTGALIGAFALGVRRALPDARWGPVLLAMFALGLVASGVFVMDPPVGYPPGSGHVDSGAASWHGVAHDAAGFVVFTALPAAALVLAVRFWAAAGLRWLGIASIVAGGLCAWLFVAYAIADETGSTVAGLLQRATIVTGWAWMALVAIILVSTSPQDAR
ncbi:DUF998 domain-containing protein [Phytohabitans suffuscus]|uniref:DUF998 domain-containing protein n=1 Tax=Phytohabitans suffuscus TaxID=624315 RepID=A0A6F8YFP5_9ACTN|nr:DUF998 domain-containing protein [Phytohabitans suffuscus]BCB84853.1 hypothetical protein Psuf_021660 [Phytohabitans suffuscus]